MQTRTTAPQSITTKNLFETEITCLYGSRAPLHLTWTLSIKTYSPKVTSRMPSQPLIEQKVLGITHHPATRRKIPSHFFICRFADAVYSPTVNFAHLYHKHGNETVAPEDTEFISTRKGVQDRDGAFDLHPKSALIQPIFRVLNDPKSGVEGILLGTVEWDLYLLGLLPEGVTGIFCVLNNTCGEVFTFLIDGPRVREFWIHS